MSAGKRGTSSLGTLTRAVAGVVRTEDAPTASAAVQVMLRAYHEVDQAEGNACPQPCMFCTAEQQGESNGN